MTASDTHSGTPIGSIFGSETARCTRTMSKAPLPRTAMTAADTEKPNSRERRRARPSPKISAVDSVRCLPWIAAARPPTKASHSVSCLTYSSLPGTWNPPSGLPIASMSSRMVASASVAVRMVSSVPLSTRARTPG